MKKKCLSRVNNSFKEKSGGLLENWYYFRASGVYHNGNEKKHVQCKMLEPLLLERISGFEILLPVLYKKQ